VTCPDADNNACTLEACTETTGCAFSANAPADTKCDDKLKCTSFTGTPNTDDKCDGSGKCQGKAVTCPDTDKNPCTTEACTETTGCAFSANVPEGQGTCTDNNACTSYEGVEGAGDKCDGGGKCNGFPVDCEFIISTSFSGPAGNVAITLKTLDDKSGVEITVTSNPAPGTNYIGDIRGVFFHVKDDNVDKIKTQTAPQIRGQNVPSINGFVIGPANSVQKVANDVIMNGDANKHKYDVGVQIGTQGIGKDDIRTTTFIVKGLTTADFTSATEFGVRLTSVGTVGGARSESSKVYGNSDCCVSTPPSRVLHNLRLGF
jgi:hypothetical protein